MVQHTVFSKWKKEGCGNAWRFNECQKHMLFFSKSSHPSFSYSHQIAIYKGYLRWNLMSTMGFWGTLFKTHRFSFGSPNSLRKKCPVGSPIAGGKDPGFQASIKQKLSEWHIGEWPWNFWCATCQKHLLELRLRREKQAFACNLRKKSDSFGFPYCRWFEQMICLPSGNLT